MILSRFAFYAFIVCFGLLSLMALQLTKRPLCIDSKVVERIDRHDGKAFETVYRCALLKEVPYSSYFGGNLPELNTRIQRTERLLESIEPFQRKVQVMILKSNPLLYRIHGHQIYIGEELLSQGGHLEKAVAKVWLRERNRSSAADYLLVEEVLTDFILFLQEGTVKVGELKLFANLQLESTKWPQVIKSVSGYCKSSWKRSEDMSSCKNPVIDAEDFNPEVVSLALRPLITESWIRAYQKLNGKQRFDFVKHFRSLVRRADVNQAEELKGLALATGSRRIQNILLMVKDPEDSNSKVAKRFTAKFKDELSRQGFQGDFNSARFDIVYLSTEPLNEGTEKLKSFAFIAANNPQLRIAVKDQNHLWMLPSMSPVPANAIGVIKAQKVIVEKCGDYNFSYVLSYSEVTQKLLVVDSCKSKNEIHYASYVKKGVESFGKENKEIAFVQFHLPSLVMRKTEIASSQKVLDFVRRRDPETSSSKGLGWREVRWSPQASAFQLKADVEAIEWFRVIN